MTPAAAPETAAIAGVLERLEAAYGDRMWHWYPEHVDGPMDVIAGAVLVQHTNWRNAERALERLRAAGALDADRLLALPEAQLADLVRPSGTPTVKAKRLRALATEIVRAGGLTALFELPDAGLRQRLLATHGVGDETADAILLYAAGRRAFVIDAYTRRLFGRLGSAPAHDSYAGWQRHFEDALPGHSAASFQRHHAHIVLHAKERCRVQPRCAGCPLLDACPEGRPQGRPERRPVIADR